MANYHVGCGITGIYAGTLNKAGNMWNNKSDVTDEAIRAVAQYLLEHEEMLQFKYDGQEYALAVSSTKGTVPERGEAHWVFGEEWSPSTPAGPAECEWIGWVCGNCQEFPTDDDWDDPDAPPKMEFCPHCGYKMLGSEAVSRVSTTFGKSVKIAVEKSMEDIKNTDDENKTFDELIWD